MRKAGVILAAVALAGTASAQFNNGFGQSIYPPIQWSTVAQGTDSHIKTAERVTLTTQFEWERYFRRMAGVRHDQKIRIPRVANWFNESIVVIHTGQQRTGGFFTYVETVVRQNSWDWDIRYVLQRPHPQSSVIQAYCSPYVIVRIQKQTGRCRFVSRVITPSQIIVSHGHGHCGCCHAPPVYMFSATKGLIRLDDNDKKDDHRGHGGR